VVVGKVVSSDGGKRPAIVTREPKAFGVFLLARGDDYRSFDASGNSPGQLGPAQNALNGKVYTINPGTPLYGPGCPLVAQVLIPSPPLCFAQIGVATDNKTITFVTTMAAPVPDDGAAPLTYKGTVAKSSKRELDLTDGTILRWGDNPKFDAKTCKGLGRDGFDGIVVEAEIDRFGGRIGNIKCPGRTPS
jgi:hypothetical protein